MPKNDFFGRELEEELASELHLTVAEVRELYGMRPLKPGFIDCLKCEQRFLSWDTVLNRKCDACKAEEEEAEVVFLEDLEGDEVMDTVLMDGEEE